MTKDEQKPLYVVRTRRGGQLALLRDVELIAIALLIMLSIGLAVAATKLVMDVLLAAMRLRRRDRASASPTWSAKRSVLNRPRRRRPIPGTAARS
jgi:hypothetical protein